jgi:hypothetical protein
MASLLLNTGECLRRKIFPNPFVLTEFPTDNHSV